MSRIEKAIEMAAETRTTDGVRDVPSQAVPRSVGTAEVDVAREAFDAIVHPEIKNPFLVTANGKNSPAAEQYRKLKSSIVKLAQLGRFDKSLMVTSAIGGEGKTLTSLNLAISLAQEFDHTVLLIEADIRRPTILRYLDMEASMGLTDCVLDDIDVGDVLVKTGIGKLTVLPAGKSVQNPVELFSSNRMQQILTEIKERYVDRYVIIDTTPLLPFAEPQFIANSVGGVLFVVREGYTSTDKVTKALALLKNHNLLGVVCNGMSQITSGGKYGYYGYYENGYK
jgi:protein-tyrosine kinase